MSRARTSGIRRKRRGWGALARWAAVVGGLAAIAGCTHARPSVPRSSTARAPGELPGAAAQTGGLTPPAVPQGRAYLGAWVNPAGLPADQAAQDLGGVSDLEQATGAPLSILGLYTGFGTPAPIRLLTAIAGRGAIPLISWGCRSTAAVASGTYDVVITRYAEALRQYGHPVFLRWFWEMNLPTARSVQCDGSGGPAGFVAAWRRVWSIFRRVGAANVAFVWCPGLGTDATTMGGYFPGAGYVDWIAADGYDLHHLGLTGFQTVFTGWYQAFAGYGKPMMVAETGAMEADQAEYLDGIGTAVPTLFPEVRALVYFDARGPAGSWVLTSQGLAAFARLAHQPFFSASP